MATTVVIFKKTIIPLALTTRVAVSSPSRVASFCSLCTRDLLIVLLHDDLVYLTSYSVHDLNVRKVDWESLIT